MICSVAAREYCTGGSFHSQRVLHVPAGDFGAERFRSRRTVTAGFTVMLSRPLTHTPTARAKAVRGTLRLSKLLGILIVCSPIENMIYLL